MLALQFTWFCSECGARFSELWELHRHLEEQHDTALYKCPLCPFAHESIKNIINVHANVKHQGKMIKKEDVAQVKWYILHGKQSTGGAKRFSDKPYESDFSWADRPSRA